VTLSLLLALTLLFQPGQPPARDRANTTHAPTASVEGRVLDATTQAPLRRAIVRLTGPTLPQRMTTRTDEGGRFAFRALPPGRYTLTASKPRYLTLQYGQRRPFEQGRRVDLAAKQVLKGVDVMLPRAAAISGTVVEPGGDPIDRTWVMAFRTVYASGRERLTTVATTVTNDIGQYRLSGLPPGEYYLMTREVAIPPGEFTDDVHSYAHTFYPSTINREEAQRVRVGLGQEIVNLDLPVVIARTATLSGTVSRADGTPVTAQRVSLLSGPESGMENSIAGGASLDARGRFRISGVPAGAYQLSVGDKEDEGVLPVTATGADQADLSIVVGEGGTMSGRIVTSTGEPPPFPVGALQLTARTSGDPWLYRRTVTSVRPDWTFSATGLLGPRLLRATRLPDAWWLKAVLLNDRDVTDTAIDVNHGDAIAGLTIVLDNDSTNITGYVKDGEGASIADYTVVVFAEDASRWIAETRFVRAERPDHAGRFSVSGMPPGAYLVAAVEFVEEGRWLDPSYLESLRPRARKLVLEAAQKATLDLLVSK
jgi:protocatechuate 3,4-dioxygenase beta subunit